MGGRCVFGWKVKDGKKMMEPECFFVGIMVK